MLGAFCGLSAALLLAATASDAQTLTSLRTYQSGAGLPPLTSGAGTGAGNVDVDGDGHPEVLVGAPGVGASAGAVYVLQTDPTSLAVTSSVTLTRAQGGLSSTDLSLGDEFGSSIAPLYDPSSGGKSIVAVGAPGYGLTSAGAVFVLFMQPSPISVSAFTVLSHGIGGVPAASSTFGVLGRSLAFLGDVDGDGIAMELAVGIPGATGGGAVVLWWLSPSSGQVVQAVTLKEGFSGIGASGLGGADQFGSAVTRVQVSSFERPGEPFVLAVGDRQYKVPGESETGGVYTLHLSGSPPEVTSLNVHAEGLGGVPAGAAGTKTEFGSAVVSVGNTLNDGWSTTTLVVAARDDDDAAVDAGALYVMVHSVAPTMPVQSLTKLVPGTTAFPVPSVGSSFRFGAALFASGDLQGAGATGHLLVGASEAGVANRGWLQALSLTDARPLAAAVALDLVSSTSAPSPPALRQSPFERLPQVSIGGSPSATVAARLPSSLAAQASSSSILLGGRPCNISAAAPASWWGGAGVVCTGTPLASVGAAVPLTFGNITAQVLTPSAAWTLSVDEFATTRWVQSVFAGDGAFPRAALKGGDNAASALAFLGDADADGLANEVAVGVPEFGGAGAVMILSLARFAEPDGPPQTGGGTGGGSPTAEEFTLLGSGVPTGYSLLADGVAGIEPGTIRAGDKFGSSVVRMPGVGMEGQAVWSVTLAVGAPHDDDGGSDAGRVFLLAVQTTDRTVRASATLTPGSGVLSAMTLESKAYFGSALAAGPQAGALLVGAPGAFDDRGAIVRVVVSTTTGQPVAADLFAAGNGGIAETGALAAGAAFGSSVAHARLGALSQVEPVILAGAPRQNSEGGAMLILQMESAKVVSRVTTMAPAETSPIYGQAGAALAVADLDGDGRDEVLVGSPAAGQSGAVHIVFFGPSGTVVGTTSVTTPTGGTLLGGADGGRLGQSIAFLGDLNGAGHAAEFAIGAPRAANPDEVETGGFAVLSLGSVAPLTAERFVPGDAFEVQGVASSGLGVPQAGGLLELGGAGFRGPVGTHLVIEATLVGSACGSVQVSVDGTRIQCTAAPGYGAGNVTVVANGVDRSWLRRDRERPIEASYVAPVLASVSSTQPIDRLPQTGGVGGAVVLFGTGLLDPTLFTSIPGVHLMVGPSECTSVGRNTGGTQLTCNSLPRGVGGPHPLRLLLPGGQASNSLSVSYAPASVTSLAPSSVTPSLTATVAFNVTGTSFGLGRESITSLVIGGNACPDSSIRWVSPTLVRCLNASLAGLSTRDVVLTLGGVPSAGGEGRLSFADPPFMVGVVPSLVPAAGGVNVTFFAANLAGNSVAQVSVGGVPCIAWQLSDAFQGWCTVPAGTGRDVSTTMTTSAGIVGTSPRGLIDYRAPVVSAIAPAFAVSNPTVRYTFRITGGNFGPTPASLGPVSVGGAACRPATWLSDAAIDCVNVSAPWADRVIRVSVGGQKVAVGGVFDFLPPPVITTVVPAGTSTLGGDLVRIEGEGFGNLTGVSIGGTRCASFARVSSFVATCVSPPGVGAGLVVRVETATNGAVGLASFTYTRPRVLAAVRSTHSGTPLAGAGSATAFAGEGSVNLVISVGSAGTDALQLGTAGIRTATPPWSAACQSATVLARAAGQITKILCAGLSLATAPAGGEVSASAFVSVAGQASLDAESAGAVTIIGQPQVSAVSPPSGVSTAGGANLSVVGLFFGAQASAVTAVRVGPYAATLLQHVSPTELIVTAPRGVGASLPIVVTTLGGLSSGQGPAQVAFSPPSITGVSPTYILAGRGIVNVEITGQDLGHSAQDVNRVDFGSTECTAVSMTAAGVVRCRLNVTLLGTVSASLPVKVTTGGQASAEVAIPLFGTPAVQAVTPGSAPTLGLGNASSAPVVVLGSNFGQKGSDVTSVTVSGVQVPRMEWVSSTELRIAVQPGVGASAPVVVTTLGGLSSRPLPLFAYQQAEVTALDPPYAMTGNLSLSFTVNGSNFGNSQADLTSVSVGGRPCARSVWVSPTQVRCFDVRAEAFLSSSVTVTVGGQEGLRNSFLERSPDPTIRTVSPSVAEVGATVLVLGDGFGRRLEDVRRVTVAGNPCPTIVHQGTTAVQCVMPPVATHLLDVANADPTLLGNLPVVVETVGGLLSTAGRVSYPGAGVPLRTAPGFTTGWRDVGQTGTVQFTWTFPRDNPDDAVAAVTSFGFEMAAAGAAPSTASGASDGARSDSVSSNSQLVALSGTPTESTDGQVLYSHTLAAIQVQPVIVRVRAENPTGPGPWSNWSSPVPANCQRNEYLTTQKPVADWECQECPTGAFCGGTQATNVTSRAGFWRVPWSPAGIGFRKCPLSSACLGFDESAAASSAIELNASASSSARRLSVTKTLSDLVSRLTPPAAVASDGLGNPYDDENCAQGYTGILCAECSPGYARWNQHECAKCAEPSLVIAAMIGVSVVVCAAIGFLIYGALQSGSGQGGDRQSKTMVPGTKIVFSHLQTVAIAASLNLRWPPSVVALFSTMQIASSVSSDVLSLDCALPHTPSRLGDTLAESFFARSAVMLMVPVILVFLAGVAWVFVIPVLSPCVKACARRLCPDDVHRVQPEGQGPATTRSASAGRMAEFVPDGRWVSGDEGNSDDDDDADSKGVPSQVVKLPPIRPRPAWGSHKSMKPEGAAASQGAAASAAVGASTGPSTRPAARVLAAPTRRVEAGPPVRLTIVDKLTIAAIVVGFTVHMSVTRASLALLTCTTISHTGEVAAGSSVSVADAKATATAECAGNDPSRRLAAELGICCNDPSQLLFMFGMGVPGILLYAFGIPLIAALALYSRRHSLESDRRTRTVLGFLYLGFKPRAYAWESVTMVRKAAVATIAVLLAPTGSANQTYAAILVVFLLTVAHLIVMPYQDKQLNRLELAALVTAFLTFEFGLFLTDDASDTGVDAILAELSTIAIFAVNCLFLALAAWTIGHAAAKETGIARRLGFRPVKLPAEQDEIDEEGSSAASSATSLGAKGAAASPAVECDRAVPGSGARRPSRGGSGSTLGRSAGPQSAGVADVSEARASMTRPAVSTEPDSLDA